MPRRAFVGGVSSGEPPIPLEELVATSLATFRIQDSIRSGSVETVEMKGLAAAMTLGVQAGPKAGAAESLQAA